MAGFDEAVEFGQMLQKMKKSRQISLFGYDDEQESSSNQPHTLPQTEEWHENQLWQYEKEVMGFYITGHPLQRYEKDLKLHTTYSTQDLASLITVQEVKIGGLLKVGREIMTKKGNRMAFATLEDNYGFAEVVLFPEIYSSSLELLKREIPVLVKGQVDLKDDKANIVATEIIALDELRRKSVRQFHVKLALEELTSQDLQGLHHLFHSSPGQSEVYLHLLPQDKGEIVLMADSHLQVNPSEDLIMAIENRLGKGAVLLER